MRTATNGTLTKMTMKLISNPLIVKFKAAETCGVSPSKFANLLIGRMIRPIELQSSLYSKVRKDASLRK